MKLFMSSIPPPVTDSGGVNIDYGFHTDYPLRLDSVLFLDQVGLDAGTIGRIDSISFDRYGRVMVVNTGQTAYFVYTDAPSSLDEFRLERFYNGSYADPRLSSNSVTSGQISVSVANVSHVRFSPNNYVYTLRQYTDTKQDFQIRGNVESTGTFNTFSGGNYAATVDYGSGQLFGMSWYGGYVYVSVGNSGNGTATITRYDFAEPTAAEYETLAAGGTFNPTTNGMFSNAVSKNITSAGGPNWSAAPEAHFNHDGTILILSLRSSYGQIYYFNCPTAYDHSSITSYAPADALSYSSSQYYDLGVSFRAGYACSVGSVQAYYTFPYPDSNGDNSMVIVTGVTGGTTNDEEYMACLFRWEKSGQPDPLPTIHIDFESTNTYLVNTHYPSATISYTQNTQYAVVGSNCAYINGTAGSELIITEPNVGNSDQRDFLARSHTLSAWFRFSSLSGIVDLVSQGGSSSRPKFRYDASNGYFTMSVTDNSRGVFEQRWNYTLSTDTWYHIVYMCSVDGSAVSTAPADGKGMILFVNGTELTRTYKSTNYSTLLNSKLMAYRSQIMTCSILQGLNNDPPDYWIGRGPTGVMTGYVDDVRLYKARLPDSYVTTLYNLKNTSIESFTYTYNSITITKDVSAATDWSWTLNGVSQGTVTGTSGTTQTITGLTLSNGDVVVVTISSSSVTETLSGLPARITSFTTPNSQRIVITKDASDATNWSWSLNGVSQGTITGASGTTQTYNFTNRVLQNGDTVAVTMSGSTVTQTLSGLEVTSFSINYCIGGRTLTHNNPNDVYVYLYDNNSGELHEVLSWGDTENSSWSTYTNSSINFRTSSMRVIMKFVDGPHVHDTGIYSVTLNGTTKDFTSDFSGFTINDFVSTNFNINTATAPSGSWTRRTATSYNGSNILVSAHPTGNAFFFYEGSGNTSAASIGTAWIISPTIDPTVNEITTFTYTSSSITITKDVSAATDWSWTLNGVSQGTVTGTSGTTQTITGLTLANGDVVVVTMASSSVTETLSGIEAKITTFTYTSSSITITKDVSAATDWSWTLNGVSQGTVTGTSGTTQTITGLTLSNGDVVVVTMSSSSVTETLSGLPVKISSFTTPNSQRIVITKDASDATNWSWSLNGVSQGTITGASGTTQTYNFTNRVLQNGDTVAVTMSGSTVTQTLSGLSVSSFSINYCIGGKTLTHNDPNDVYVYLYDNNSGELHEVLSWGDTENTSWLTYTNNSVNFRTSSMRVIMKFVDGPHVHDTGIYSITLNGTTKNFTSDFAGFTINDFVSTNFNINTATAPSGSWRRRSKASSNGSNILVSAHPTGNAFFFYEGSGNTSVAGRGTAWIISPNY